MILIIIIQMEGIVSESERAILVAYLRDRGQKMTGPRETVLDAFLALERHVTAEELFEAARRIDPGIGQATVFRTIKLLAEAGLAREACPDVGARHFEHAWRHEHHDHLVCVDCGAVVEFKDEAVEVAQEAIYRRYGFAPSDHRLELQGLCPVCSAKAEKGGLRA
jgi:Fur family transcriptional regulator, ferric uptake regulator